MKDFELVYQPGLAFYIDFVQVPFRARTPQFIEHPVQVAAASAAGTGERHQGDAAGIRKVAVEVELRQLRKRIPHGVWVGLGHEIPIGKTGHRRYRTIACKSPVRSIPAAACKANLRDRMTGDDAEAAESRFCVTAVTAVQRAASGRCEKRDGGH